MEQALDDVRHERLRQDAKWGEQNHDPKEWMLILMEEVGETAQTLQQCEKHTKTLGDYRQEMVQVAAVAVAAIESLDRAQGV